MIHKVFCAKNGRISFPMLAVQFNTESRSWCSHPNNHNFKYWPINHFNTELALGGQTPTNKQIPRMCPSASQSLSFLSLKHVCQSIYWLLWEFWTYTIDFLGFGARNMGVGLLALSGNPSQKIENFGALSQMRGDFYRKYFNFNLEKLNTLEGV